MTFGQIGVWMGGGTCAYNILHHVRTVLHSNINCILGEIMAFIRYSHHLTVVYLRQKFQLTSICTFDQNVNSLYLYPDKTFVQNRHMNDWVMGTKKTFCGVTETKIKLVHYSECEKYPPFVPEIPCWQEKVQKWGHSDLDFRCPKSNANPLQAELSLSQE